MKKILSFVVVMAAAALVGCAGNQNKKAAEAQAGETVIEAAACDKCDQKCAGDCDKCDQECTEKCGQCDDAAACGKCEKECAEKSDKKECCKK